MAGRGWGVQNMTPDKNKVYNRLKMENLCPPLSLALSLPLSSLWSFIANPFELFHLFVYSERVVLSVWLCECCCSETERVVQSFAPLAMVLNFLSFYYSNLLCSFFWTVEEWHVSQINHVLVGTDCVGLWCG